MMIGFRYLLTSQSLVMAHQKLAEAERRLYSTSSLWESCDMAYVEGRTAHISNLREMLNKAGTKGVSK